MTGSDHEVPRTSDHVAELGSSIHWYDLECREKICFRKLEKAQVDFIFIFDVHRET